MEYLRYTTSLKKGVEGKVKQLLVNAQTGLTTIVDVPDVTLSLAEAQMQQINHITAQYQTSIQFIQSSALGTVHTYLADDTSMAKFNAEYTYANGSSYDGGTINWYTVENGGTSHTKTQFNQVWMDGRNYLSNQFNKWDSLVKQINACKDVASVQAITW